MFNILRDFTTPIARFKAGMTASPEALAGPLSIGAMISLGLIGLPAAPRPAMPEPEPLTAEEET